MELGHPRLLLAVSPISLTGDRILGVVAEGKP